MTEKKITIDEFGMYLLEEYDEILLRDQNSDKLLDSKPIDFSIEKVRVDAYNEFTIWGSSSDEFHKIKIGLLAEFSKIETVAEYILNIKMISPTHGFFFGLYEVGEFEIDPTFQFQIIKSMKIHTYGARSFQESSQQMYVFMKPENPSEESVPSLIQIDWKPEIPTIISEIPIEGYMVSMDIHQDLGYFGFRSGMLEIWNLSTLEVSRKESIFQGEIKKIEVFPDLNIVVVAGGSLKVCEVAVFSLGGDLIWKKERKSAMAYGAIPHQGNIHVVSEKGDWFQFDLETGNETSKSTRKGVGSSLCMMRDWLFGFGAAGHFSGVFLKETTKKTNIYIEDPYIRCVISHPFGIITGDDEGYLRFWKVGTLSIKKKYINTE